MAKDGPLAVEERSRPLLEASLAVTTVKSDDQGNTRITKESDNRARDDVAAALVLACGGIVGTPKPSKVYLGRI